jgi:hypothetical protein
MAHIAEKRIYRLLMICVVLTVLAVGIPRFVPSQEGGLAGAATAVIVFLGLLAAAAAVSLFLLVVTVRAYRDLSLFTRLAGIGPSVILVMALAFLVVFLQY